MNLRLPISNLADWKSVARVVCVRRIIRETVHDGGMDGLGADSGTSSAVAFTPLSVPVARHYENIDWLTLGCPVTVVQVVKVPGATLVEGG